MKRPTVTSSGFPRLHNEWMIYIHWRRRVRLGGLLLAAASTAWSQERADAPAPDAVPTSVDDPFDRLGAASPLNIYEPPPPAMAATFVPATTALPTANAVPAAPVRVSSDTPYPLALPLRVEAGGIHFANVPAGALVMELAANYHIAITLAGDSRLPITASPAGDLTIEENLRHLFPLPQWIVGREGTGYIVSANPPNRLRRIAWSELQQGFTR